MWIALKPAKRGFRGSQRNLVSMQIRIKLENFDLVDSLEVRWRSLEDFNPVDKELTGC